MKIIHVTDNHLVAPGMLLNGLNPIERLEHCIEAVNLHQSDAEFCVFSGDIANSGKTVEYQAFKEAVSKLKLKYYVMMGNHDDRTVFCQSFAATPCDPNGFVQQVINTDQADFLLLDTAADNGSWGEYCEPRAQWLRQQLDAAGEKPVFIFMHHPPFDIGLPTMDRIKLLDIQHFSAAIEGFKNIRHIFLGHVHRTIYGSWRSIPYSILPGTNHQVAFNRDVLRPVPHSLEPPAYGMVLIERDQVIIHPHFFLENKDLPLKEGTEWLEQESAKRQ